MFLLLVLLRTALGGHIFAWDLFNTYGYTGFVFT